MSGFAQSSALQKYMAKNGRFPKVSLQIQPLDQSRRVISFDRFSDYTFQTSVLVPVDSFSFRMVNPTISGSIRDFVSEGDIAVLSANGKVIATGLVDTVAIENDENGERVEILGRTLIAQLEDQSAISEVDDPFWLGNVSIQSALSRILPSTRVNYYRLQQAPSGQFLFATEPGESKLSALTRYIEPLNCLVWMDPDGTLVIGRPDMGGDSLGTFVMDRGNRRSNCMSMKAIFSSTQIPNVILPIWAGQETTLSRVSPEQRILNAAKGPSRLYSLSHRVPRAIVVSTPQGADAQAGAVANQFVIAGSNVLQAYAKRAIARANVDEVGVQVNVKGHYNDNLDPILPDTNYQCVNPRAQLSEKMYLHTVEYTMDAEGQKTSMHFCRLGSIVADVAVKSVKSTSKRQVIR